MILDLVVKEYCEGVLGEGGCVVCGYGIIAGGGDCWVVCV